MFRPNSSYHVSKKHDNRNLLRYRKPEDDQFRLKHVVLKTFYYYSYNYYIYM